MKSNLKNTTGPQAELRLIFCIEFLLLKMAWGFEDGIIPFELFQFVVSGVVLEIGSLIYGHLEAMAPPAASPTRLRKLICQMTSVLSSPVYPLGSVAQFLMRWGYLCYIKIQLANVTYLLYINQGISYKNFALESPARRGSCRTPWKGLTRRNEWPRVSVLGVIHEYCTNTRKPSSCILENLSWDVSKVSWTVSPRITNRPDRLSQELTMSGLAAITWCTFGSPIWSILRALVSIVHHLLVYPSGGRLLKQGGWLEK
jgi:hypothetical protein